MNATDVVFCKKYDCSLCAAACGSRHLKANIPLAKKYQRSRVTDPNCQNCRMGKRMVRVLTRETIMTYREGLKAIRTEAKRRLGWRMMEDA